MLLLGLGLRHLSMPPHQLPEVKRVIRGIRAQHAREVAAEALRMDTAQDVIALLQESLRRAVPETDTPSVSTEVPGG
jgi:phosphotransferase system enzyme I (PtsI)